MHNFMHYLPDIMWHPILYTGMGIMIMQCKRGCYCHHLALVNNVG